MSSPRVRDQEMTVLQRVRAMFGRWLAVANGAVLSSARMTGLLPDPTAVYSTAPVWQQEVQRLMPDLETAASIGWSEAFQRETFSSNSSHVLSALSTSRNLLQGIPDEVHQYIVEDLVNGLSQGESREQVIARVNMTLSMTGASRWENRARVIAMTETTRAANAGALAAALSAEYALGPMLKRWNDSGDHRVRETHERAHGTELPLAQPFIVGGFPLMYPSEPFGPSEEVIGCRCDLSFRRMDP